MQAWNLLWATPDSRKFCYTRHVVASPATDWSSPWSILRSLYKIMCLLFPQLNGLQTHIPKVALICKIWLPAEIVCMVAWQIAGMHQQESILRRTLVSMSSICWIFFSGVPSMVHTNVFSNKAIANVCPCLFPTSTNWNILLFYDRVQLGCITNVDCSCSLIRLIEALGFLSYKIGNCRLDVFTFKVLHDAVCIYICSGR